MTEADTPGASARGVSERSVFMRGRLGMCGSPLPAFAGTSLAGTRPLLMQGLGFAPVRGRRDGNQAQEKGIWWMPWH